MLKTAEDYESAKLALKEYDRAVKKCTGAYSVKDFRAIPLSPEVQESLQRQCENQAKLPFKVLKDYVQAYEFFNLYGMSRITVPWNRYSDEDTTITTANGIVKLGTVKLGKELPHQPMPYGRPARRQQATIRATNGGVYKGTFYFGSNVINVRRVK